MTVRPTGVIPPMTTPFRKDGEIDFSQVAPQIDWMIGAGVHGLALAARPARATPSTMRNIAT